jgi:hypothetical protein
MAENAAKGGPPKGEVISVDAGRERGSRLRLRDADATAASLIMATGATFAIIGLVDLALMWYPLRLGSAPWEFGTLSSTFDNLPMTALGVALVTLGVIRHPWLGATWVRGVAVLYVILGVLLLGMAVLYGLAAVEVIGRAPQESMGAFKRALVKNVVEIVAYLGATSFLAVACWRGVERVR